MNLPYLDAQDLQHRLQAGIRVVLVAAAHQLAGDAQVKAGSPRACSSEMTRSRVVGPPVAGSS